MNERGLFHCVLCRQSYWAGYDSPHVCLKPYREPPPDPLPDIPDLEPPRIEGGSSP